MGTEKKQVIVSMTSFPAAISFAVKTLKSILDGSVKPDKLVLYLATPQFPNHEIPKELHDLARENQLLEIRFHKEDTRSYKKLVPALEDFPNDIIVTVDDDVLYHKNLLRRLLDVHKKYPDAIIGHRCRCLKLNAPYSEWKKYRWYSFFTKNLTPKFSNLQTGVGGVLYPPGCLKKEMLDSKIFMDLAPTADDIWFWAAAVANGTRIAQVPFGFCKPHGIKKPKGMSLRDINVKSGVDVNRATLEKIIEKYPIIKQRVENE
ncbi:MAG: glycosyltransferase [Azonexus sp.]|jgi:hypothetical protein|nr:glycosyltransferase [Azonexus sp.]